MGNLNLFISYSHADELGKLEFRKHIKPLEQNQSIQVWCDRAITGGEDLNMRIFEELDNADVICLLLSANYLSSESCQTEKLKALESLPKGVVVIPIILSECAWLDDADIKKLLAFPKDGQAVSGYSNRDKAWFEVYEGLKNVVEPLLRIRNAKIKDTFQHFLDNAEMLTNAHPTKDTITLSDVFIFPDLKKYDDLGEYEKIESSKKVIDEFVSYSKILIAGESQSGRTSLCKQMFLRLRELGYFPVYLEDKSKYFAGLVNNRIRDAFSEQYEGITFDEVACEKVIPIVDNFQFAKQKNKILKDLSIYRHQAIIVDDIFSLNIQDEGFTPSYNHFKIKELSPSLRHKLIKKWVDLSPNVDNSINEQYRVVDNKTELVDASLGKVIGTGIMPAYPFFVLSVMNLADDYGSSLNQKITSQGHCYQTLIYLCLRKKGVANEDFDTYINFLSELAFFFYSKNKKEISAHEFNTFMDLYLSKYNLPIERDTLLDKLNKTQIIACDSCGNYIFCYPYLHYFFIGKYISEHIEDCKERINEIIENLHITKNAYVAIFISHHSRNEYILDLLGKTACNLFSEYAPATLNKEEMQTFDEKAELIIKAVLPSAAATPERERANRLKAQDEKDELENDAKDEDALESELDIKLRKSIKTVEVMGRVIKNRAGSLERDRLETIFEDAMKVYLRIITSYIDLLESNEEKVIEIISEKLKKNIEESKEKRKNEGKPEYDFSPDKLKKISGMMYWNLNFIVVYSVINLIVHSLGSDKLIEIMEKVCDKENSPASFLVKHGILMWYNKNIQIENIIEGMGKDEFSDTSKRILKFMIVNHCSMHAVDYQDKQKIGKKLDIPSSKLQLQLL